MPSIRVAVVQMFCRDCLSENRDRILELMDDVGRQGYDLAVFPEGILCDPEAQATAADFEAAVEVIRERARTRDLNVIVGILAPVVEVDCNQALVVDRRGHELLRYQKDTEVPQRIFIDSIACGVSICSDRWYLEHADLPCISQEARILIEWGETETLTGGSPVTVRRPDSGHWVAAITRM